jgi:hypothetical protein
VIGPSSDWARWKWDSNWLAWNLNLAFIAADWACFYEMCTNTGEGNATQKQSGVKTLEGEDAEGRDLEAVV